MTREKDAMGWQPIETAPKDGRRFVVLIPQSWRRSDYRPCVAYWERYMKPPRLIFDDWSTSPQPTHWMPLPAPPRAALDMTVDKGE
jgi:hypothetical protein